MQNKTLRNCMDTTFLKRQNYMKKKIRGCQKLKQGGAASANLGKDRTVLRLDCSSGHRNLDLSSQNCTPKPKVHLTV